MSIEIAGMAHVQLTVNDLQRAMPFYEKVLGFLGMRPVVKSANGLYMIGGHTAVSITRSSGAHRDVPFDQRRLELNFVPGKGLFADLDPLPLTRFPGYEHYPE